MQEVVVGQHEDQHDEAEHLQKHQVAAMEYEDPKNNRFILVSFRMFEYVSLEMPSGSGSPPM